MEWVFIKWVFINHFVGDAFMMSKPQLMGTTNSPINTVDNKAALLTKALIFSVACDEKQPDAVWLLYQCATPGVCKTNRMLQQTQPFYEGMNTSGIWADASCSNNWTP